MHSHSLASWQHEHQFLGAQHARNERRIWLVVALTAAMMVAEIAGGTLFGSMALLADGWHMATHVAALGIAALAYRFARAHANDPRFSFGTGKVGELAGFSSAVILGVIALFIAAESLGRVVSPTPIAFAEAIPIAVVGLLVNLASAWLLRDDHDHHHGHAHHHDHDDHHHGNHDTNARAAYAHVLADALTSVLAIAALLAGRSFGLTWLDPVIGLVGAGVILIWSWGLLKTAGATLLDAVPAGDTASQVRSRLETDGDRVADLHLWRLGPGHLGVIAAIVTDHPRAPDDYKLRLADMHELAHVTIEVQACPHPAH